MVSHYYDASECHSTLQLDNLIFMLSFEMYITLLFTFCGYLFSYNKFLSRGGMEEGSRQRTLKICFFIKKILMINDFIN